ncbi:DUF6461 domain-containing protein [Lentzea sp. HUAS12]|uniref:DUF6461 domain-containing protein n=1 Tax=Lentzea sp. HUAS12 TaxID=2951806 RepID=UPI0020A18300|nr:DUF6461 domain-containing protein [Lentzea sp. HUAS12]USX48915.1 DUF6461 domain-containing protein [Lentzea sp. HUAS12]
MGDFEELVRTAAPSVEALIPAEPAAELGRHTVRRSPDRFSGGSVAQQALHLFPGLIAERLLGALELGVARLDLTAPAHVVARLRPLPDGSSFMLLSANGQSAMTTPMSMVNAVHPGAADLVVDQVRALLPDLGDVTGDEAAIAAKRGAAHLAVAVVVSRAVLNALGTPTAADPAAAIGIAIGAIAEVLPDVPMPAAYEQAVLEKRRAEYRGSSWSTTVPVFDHEFVFAEEAAFPGTDFTATGLVAAIDTGFAVRTGIAEGTVPVSVRVVLDEPGEPDLADWDEVAETSFAARRGDARFGHGGMPPWPGEFRVRVHAHGRDGDDDESHHLLIWPAPHAEPLVHKKTDRVGHRLRGEPEPARAAAPEAALRWLPALLGAAATVTVVTGVADVDGFGPDAITAEVDGGVVVLELDGFAGTERAVLERLSRNGRAASHFWNGNGDRCLSFARAGRVLVSREPWEHTNFGDDPEVVAALAGLDFDAWRHKEAKGVTAVTRFTGVVLPQDDLTAVIRERVSRWEG